MNVGRNDPCPCGSGKKYKRCCLGTAGPAEEETVVGSGGPYRPHPEVLEAARSEPSWEVDLIVPPWRFEEDPGVRPGLLGVMAGPCLVHFQMFQRSSGEPEEVARTFLRAVTRAAGRVGTWPDEVVVRHLRVAHQMEEALARHETALAVDSHLPELDGMIADMLADMSGADPHELPDRFVYSFPQAWAAWDLPGPLLLRLLHGAADLHRAAPWELFHESEALEAVLPDGGVWYAVALGAIEEEKGIVVYADPDDLLLAGDVVSPTEMADLVSDRFYAITFAGADEVFRPMRKEFAARGWPLASPDAYPRLLAVNTPAGGISRHDAASLAKVLHSVAALTRASHEGAVDEPWRGWRDPGTGVELFWIEPDYDLVPDDLDAEGWDEELPLPAFLLDALGEEERAALHDLFAGDEPPDPEDLNAILSGATGRYNRSPQEELGGLSPEEVHRLLEGDWSEPGGPLVLDRGLPLAAVEDTRTFRNARVFVGALLRDEGTRATKAGNLNRAFVAEMRECLEWPDTWISELQREDVEEHRKVVNEADVGHLHALRTLLDAAGLVKRRKGRWSATRSGEVLAADERAGELYALLFETHFRKLGPATFDRAGDAEGLRYGVPYSLRRLADVGETWRPPSELADLLLLPVVRERFPPWGTYDPAVHVLETRILEPLEGFGLVERQEVPDPEEAFWPSYRYRKTPLYDRFLEFEAPG